MRFFITVIRSISRVESPYLTLELLELREDESATVVNPSQFYIHYLRQDVLSMLSECDSILDSSINVGVGIG